MKTYYLKRRVIEMINGYSLIFPEPLVACDGTEYYSCRAPDGEFALLVSCKDRQHYKNLARKLKKLGKRERSLYRFSCASDSDETTNGESGSVTEKILSRSADSFSGDFSPSDAGGAVDFDASQCAD